MNFTFGIVTNNGDLHALVFSIRQLKIPTYEIVIVGSYLDNFPKGDDIVSIPFDESQKEGWITKKKNLIAEHAKYENLVIMHDYIYIHPDFYKGFLDYKHDWKVCVPRILNLDGSRYRDYILFPYYPWWKRVTGWKCDRFLLPYWLPMNAKLNRFVYISGSIYVVKRDIARAYPLNESLAWGEGEDVEWSVRLGNDGVLMMCNSSSTVQFMKYKVRSFCCDHEHVSNQDLKVLFSEMDRIEKEDPSFFAQKWDWLKRDTYSL